MKAKTFFKNGNNCYYLEFAYENGYFDRFGTYKELVKDAKEYGYNLDPLNTSLTCFLTSYLYGITERVSIDYLSEKPSFARVRKFIDDCKEILEGEEISREEAMKMRDEIWHN